MAIEFVGLNGYVSDESSYISLRIKGGDNSDSIGDQIWINKEGTEMEVLDYADDDVLQEAKELFKRGHQRAFFGALRRMGVDDI